MFRKNLATIKFLLRFVVAYVVLTATYDYYLTTVSDNNYFLADEATLLAAVQSSNLIELLGFDSSIFQHSFQHSVNFIVDGKVVSRIIEGCNGISVAILFVAFVIAFRGPLIDTLIYIPMGVLLINLANVFRLSIVTYVSRYHYEYYRFFHDYIFPAIIYGMVFILWVIWVNFFVLDNRDDKK
jgi:exosortase family protein XrtF